MNACEAGRQVTNSVYCGHGSVKMSGILALALNEHFSLILEKTNHQDHIGGADAVVFTDGRYIVYFNLKGHCAWRVAP